MTQSDPPSESTPPTGAPATESGSHHDLKEIYWRSRRGMLELELKLVPFVRDCFNDLQAQEREAYVNMLSEEDWQIFDWLQGREQPEDPVLASLLKKIEAHRGRL